MPRIVDIFPAEVHIDDERLPGRYHRVFINGDRVWVYHDAMPNESVEFQVANIETPGQRHWVLHTRDGRVVRVMKQFGCGCGSVLRQLRTPW